MAVTDAQLLVKLSTGSTTGLGNASAQGNVNLSLGGQMSSTQLVNNTLHNLFDAISGDENVALDDEYRTVFIHNSNATDTLGPNTKLWIVTDTPAGAADISLALDGTGILAYNTASQMSEVLTDEEDVPTGETFAAPLSKAAGIAVGNMGPNTALPIIIKRLAANGGARSSVSVSIRLEGDVL